MDNSNDRAPSNDPIRELFGPPPPRRPIPSNSFNALVTIFSLFSDQNPFSECASYAPIPEYLRRCVDNPSDSRRCVDNPNDSRQLLSNEFHSDVVVPRGEKEASIELAGSDTVEAHILPVPDHDANSNGISGDFCKDIHLSGSKFIIDELGRENKTLEKIPSDEEDTSIGRAEVDKVHDDLSGIERILMDGSDDFDVLQLPDKDADFDFLSDFSCILDTDVCVNKSMTVESSSNGKLTTVAVMESSSRNMKEDVAGEKKRKDVEVNRSTSGGGEAKSHTHLPVVIEISECQEVVNQNVGTYPGETQRKKRKICKEKAPQDLSEFGGLTFAAQKSNNVGGTISNISNSIGKGNKFGVGTKEKTKKVKGTSAKDVISGKSKLLVVDGETSYNMKSGGADPVVYGKMAKQSVYGNTRKSTVRKVGNTRPKSCVKCHYSREELLNLKKTTSVPEDILKIVQELDAEVHGKYQKSAAGKLTDAGGAKKEKQDIPTEDKMAEEKGSSILENKKRGTSSEARKEKKKLKKRKKRAEMNKKLGIKRLKLTPIVKPKVIQPCRHYLNGRCQEGEKCKFSHDVIPLTKSKPCCHFARHACMKGDDCPFDHQLSNYPCNSYVTTGFCSRGDSCLFSHKISAKEGSETAAVVAKCETTLDQLDKSNSKQELNAKASVSYGIATSERLKENIATQTSQQAKAPKGLSFLSSGNSSPKDSSKHKEFDLSQKSGGAAGTSSQPNIATTAVNLVKGLIDTPASDTPQGTDFISYLRASVGSSEDKKQASPSFHKDNSRFYSFRKSEKVDSSHRSGDTAGTSDQLNKEMSSGVQSVCGMPEDNPAPMNPKKISVPSSGRPPYDNCGGKSQVDSRIREKESANGSEKAIQAKLWGSPNSSGQCPTKVGVKNTPSTAQRALLSTLSFAAKYESGIKMTSAGSATEVTNNEGTSSDSGCKQNGPSKASAILDFLYSGGDKKKVIGK